MNKTELKRLNRIYNCMAIPAANIGGTQSTTVASLAGYAKDAEEGIKLARRALLACGGMSTDEPVAVQAEEAIQKLEEWFARREAARWGL